MWFQVKDSNNNINVYNSNNINVYNSDIKVLRCKNKMQWIGYLWGNGESSGMDKERASWFNYKIQSGFITCLTQYSIMIDNF